MLGVAFRPPRMMHYCSGLPMHFCSGVDRLPFCRAVVAIEPVGWTFALLVQNIRANNAGQKVVPICGAVADTTDSVIWLSYDPAHSGMSQVGGGTVPSPVIGPKAIDTLIAGELPIVVKIDVEDAELSVLSVLRRASAYRRVTDVIVEAGRGQDVDRPEIVRALLGGDGFAEVARSDPWGPDLSDIHYRRAAGTAHGSDW